MQASKMEYFISKVFFWIAFALVVAFSVAEMIGLVSGTGENLVVSPMQCRLGLEIVAILFLFLKFNFKAPALFPLIVGGWGIGVGLSAALGEPSVTTGEKNPVIKDVIEAIFWPLVCLFFYTLARYADAKIKRVCCCFVGLYLLLCGIFFIHSSELTTNQNGTYQQTNLIYFPLLLLPWIFFLKNWLARNGLIVIFVVLALISGKRGGVAALVLAYFAHAFVSTSVGKHMRVWPILLTIGFPLLLAIGLLGTVQLPVDVMIQRFEEVSDDGGSGRVDIWTNALNRQKETDAVGWIMGRGYNGTLHDLGGTAHNDFIEVLFDFGFIGLLVYGALHLCLLKHLVRLVVRRSENGPSFAAAYMIFLVMSMVSHLIIYPTFVIYIMAFFATLIGMEQVLKPARFEHATA